MKKKILIIISVIITLLILGYGSIVYIDYHNVVNGKLPILANYSEDGSYQGLGYTIEVTYFPDTDVIEEMKMKLFGKTIAAMVQDIEKQNENQENPEIVTISNGNIQNENKIDAFIDKGDNREADILQIHIISNDKTDNVTVEFVPGTYDEISFEESNIESGNTTNRQVPRSVTTAEEYEEVYGYYKITVNGEETGRYDGLRWHMKRVTKDNTVQVIMEPYVIEVIEFPVICEYSLESSNYEKKFELTYMARKDMGVKKIAEKNQFDNLDFGVYTIAGDVSITIEGDMVYSLENALTQGVLTVQDILEQAKQDEKYGFCEEAYYSDGGSTEYRYAEYTILKYNTLDGNKDLVIGMQGMIINQVNASGYKTEEEENVE